MQLSFKNGTAEAVLASLADLPEKTLATLERLELPGELGHRLMELGFIPGHHVEVAHSAPGGDPRVFRVDGSEIALRRETARHILVRVEDEL